MRRSSPNVIPRLIPREKAEWSIAVICGLFEARSEKNVTDVLTFVSFSVPHNAESRAMTNAARQAVPDRAGECGARGAGWAASPRHGDDF
jgi:hypothetical protein